MTDNKESERMYYCSKCEKMHSIDYNVHYKYKIGITDINRLKQKIKGLKKKIKEHEKLFDIIGAYMIRHHPYYDENTREKIHKEINHQNINHQNINHQD